MNSLKSMKDALRPLGLYNLGEGSFISRELSCYAQFLDEVGEAIDSLLTEGFLQTAGEEGIARMEALIDKKAQMKLEFTNKLRFLSDRANEALEAFSQPNFSAELDQALREATGAEEPPPDQGEGEGNGAAEPGKGPPDRTDQTDGGPGQPDA